MCVSSIHVAQNTLPIIEVLEQGPIRQAIFLELQPIRQAILELQIESADTMSCALNRLEHIPLRLEAKWMS